MPHPTTARGWRGSLRVGTAWAALVAAAGDNSVHAHHAIQLSIALGGPLRLGSRQQSSAAALIPSDYPHQLLPMPRVAMLFILPESRLGRRLRARYDQTQITALDVALALPLAELIERVVRGESSDSAAEAALTEKLGLVTAPEPSLDPRLARVLADIDANLERDQKLAELAALAGLSESRLAHLFRAQLGIAFRPYRRWRRIERAFSSLHAGSNLTCAAHQAGFSDSAHLSRSVVRSFGVPPQVVKSLLGGEAGV